MLNRWKLLTRKEAQLLLLWWITLLLIAITAAISVSGQQRANLSASIQRHAERIGENTSEGGQTSPERTPPPGQEKDVAQKVNIGIYLDRLPEISILGASWKADFYVWFTWKGEDLNPGETFHVVNGEVISKTLVEKKDVGDTHYALYRTIAQITKNFDITRFPRDDHMMTISIEDMGQQSYQLQYETDANASDISSRVAASGYKILSHTVFVKPHSYKSSRGNPALRSDYRATYSQFSLGVHIARPSWGLYIKLTAILYAAAAMALIALFVRSSCDRLALQTGAIFAAAANTYITSSLIPEIGVPTLADQINWIGIACIGVCLVQGVIYQYCYFEDTVDRANVAKIFDLSSFALITLLYVGINILVALSASI
jgi:hypothetical protein